jgi:hypothetical protein
VNNADKSILNKSNNKIMEKIDEEEFLSYDDQVFILLIKIV